MPQDPVRGEGALSAETSRASLSQRSQNTRLFLLLWLPVLPPCSPGLSPCVCGSLCILTDPSAASTGSLSHLSFLPCPRQAFMLGLRGCGLWAELKALRAQSQELEEVAGRRQLLLQELQAKQQRILHWRRLVVRGWPWGM